ncbi:hypothetical protein K449DRAFT_463811 [Hypoxylon sp. EC38]|nr:hypothetical protein K449DRAFT_463811 [Hypoxylon sp. EC38]
MRNYGYSAKRRAGLTMPAAHSIFLIMNCGVPGGVAKRALRGAAGVIIEPFGSQSSSTTDFSSRRRQGLGLVLYPMHCVASIYQAGDQRSALGIYTLIRHVANETVDGIIGAFDVRGFDFLGYEMSQKRTNRAFSALMYALSR